MSFLVLMYSETVILPEKIIIAIWFDWLFEKMIPEIRLRPIWTPLCVAPNLNANMKKLIFWNFYVFWSPIYPYKPKKSFDFVGFSKNLKLKKLIFQIFKKLKILIFFQISKFLKINASRQNKWSFHCQNIPNYRKTEFEPIQRGCVPKCYIFVWFLQNVALKVYQSIKRVDMTLLQIMF